MNTRINVNQLTADMNTVSPLAVTAVDLRDKAGYGVLYVDFVHGFVTVGRGPLAPPRPNARYDRMVAEAVNLANVIDPSIILLDSHDEKPEKPFPPHCLQGTGDDELIDELAFVAARPGAVVIAKECLSGVIGAMRPDGTNALFEAIIALKIRKLVVAGICTEICVLDTVLPLLSARSRGLLGDLEDIIIFEPACTTYDLPLEVALELGLPASAAHPQDFYHMMGLLIMQNHGAIIADRILK